MKSENNIEELTKIKLPDYAPLGDRIKVLKPSKRSNFISELNITTDSVVAKVSVVTNNATRRIFVDWGDLESDVVSVPPGINTSLTSVSGMPNPLPDGTYEIYHAYAVPEEKKPFEMHVTVRIQDSSGLIDQRSKTITLLPKYRVTVYRASVRLLNPCDVFGSSGEFEITQNIDGDETRRWEWRPSNNFFSNSQYFLLPESQFARTWEVGGNTIYYSYDFREKDGFLNADDKGSHNGRIGFYSETGLIEKDIKVEDPNWGSCTVRIRYDMEVTLLRPLPSIGGMATYFKVQA